MGTVALSTGYHDIGGGFTRASILRSTNSGDNTWTEVRSGTYTSGKYNGIAIDPANSERIYAFGLNYNGAAGNNENYSISIGGGVWERGNPIPNNSVSSISPIADFAIDSSNHGQNNYSSRLYAAIFEGNSGDKGVWLSTNLGTSWTMTTLTSPIRSLGFNSRVPSTIYAAGASLWKSIDNGTSWSTVSGVMFEVKQILMHPSYPTMSNYLWIVKADGQIIYKTINGGLTWGEINTSNIPKPINDLRSDKSNNAMIYVATTSGVYKIDPSPEIPTGFGVLDYCIGGSGNGPKPMSPAPLTCYPKLTCQGPNEADISGYIIYKKVGSGDWFEMGTVSILPFIDYDVSTPPTTSYCYKIKAKDLAGNLSDFTSTACWPIAKISIQENGLQETPKKFMLFQNSPNPFNPSTRIKYTIPENTYVTLKIYDVLGREVETLVNEEQTAGNKSVEFDASKLPNGIYLYRIQVGKFTDVKKMLLVK